MPDTRKRVRITTGHPGYEGRPAVLVDGEPLRCVTRFEIHHDYGEGTIPLVTLTLIGIDVDLDIDAEAQYVVKVVGPRPLREGDDGFAAGKTHG